MAALLSMCTSSASSSLSSRRAWIEIWGYLYYISIKSIWSLSSRRAWIEIEVSIKKFALTLIRSPHGERGLKFLYSLTAPALLKSLSSRRAWIEMLTFHCFPQTLHVALLTESVDWNHGGSTNIKSASSRSPHGERGLKWQYQRYEKSSDMSLSSRRAWIEILSKSIILKSSQCRSPHGERGLKFRQKRLQKAKVTSLSSRRAWIEILNLVTYIINTSLSLSSRRAWIEIALISLLHFLFLRRSPHGERGLKYYWQCFFHSLYLSLSSRRAWIEISISPLKLINLPTRRSPHGERGLKWKICWQAARSTGVALLTESVDWN